MKDDFNKEAMREKIRINLEKGWTPQTIKEELMKESLTLLERMGEMEKRVVELSDQIEFMTTEYPNG